MNLYDRCPYKSSCIIQNFPKSARPKIKLALKGYITCECAIFMNIMSIMIEFVISQ